MIELELILFKIILVILTTFLMGTIGNWVRFILVFLSGIFFCVQYLNLLPYYNQIISLIYGSSLFLFTWISFNAILVLLFSLKGNVLTILIGSPILIALVKYIREKRINSLLISNIDDIKSDTDSLIQIQSMILMIKDNELPELEILLLTGFVNVHTFDCQNQECPCNIKRELYDASSNKTSDRSLPYHKDKIFMLHFCKKMFEDAVLKFSHSAILELSFSFFLFEHMRNIRFSLIELENSKKKHPSMVQIFNAFKYKKMIEAYIKLEQAQQRDKDIYSQLSNVIEFERLLTECQKSIEKVANYQIDYWNQLNNIQPDLNILLNIGKEMYEASLDAQKYWNRLSRINPNYGKALNLFGSYLNEIKNNQELGYEMIEKSKMKSGKKSMDEMIKSSDILFDDDTAVLHVSGDKDTSGKIVKTNQGFTKVFGYNKNEVLGHSVGILMTPLFDSKHQGFMNNFFLTGKQKVFNKDMQLFANHRSGHCFHAKIHIKQIPTLSEGIQYVGLVRKIQTDHEYILTNNEGVIDSITMGIDSILQLNPKFIKENPINIQVIAPELISYFNAIDKKNNPAIKGFSDASGQKLTFIIPKDFLSSFQSLDHSNNKKEGKKQEEKNEEDINDNKSKMPKFKILNSHLNRKTDESKQKVVNIKKLLQSSEYMNSEIRQNVRCEILDLNFEISKNLDPLIVKIFKISGAIIRNRMGEKNDNSSEGEDVTIIEKTANRSLGSFENLPIEIKPQKIENAKANEKSKLLEFVMKNALNISEGNQINNVTSYDFLQSPKNKEEDSDGRLETKQAEKGPEILTKHSQNIFFNLNSQEAYEKANKKNKQIKEDNIGDAPTPNMKNFVTVEKVESKNEKTESKVEDEDNSIFYDQDEISKLSKEIKKDTLYTLGSGIQGLLKLGTIKKGDFKEEFHKDKKISDQGEASNNKNNLNIPPNEQEQKSNLSNFNTISSGTTLKMNVVPLDPNAKKEKEEEIKQNAPNIFFEYGKTDTIGSAAFAPPNALRNRQVLINDGSSLFMNEEEKIEDTSKEAASQYSNRTKRSNERAYKALEGKKELLKKTNKIRKKYPTKIITNPAYEEGNTNEMSKYIEKEPSEGEMKLRENLRTHFKKAKQEQGKEEEKEKDPNKNGKESKNEKVSEIKETKKEEIEFDEEEKNLGRDDPEGEEAQSSVNSGSTGSTIRSYYSLRTAIDEKYIPASVMNLKIAMYLIFLLALALSIVYFVMQFLLFNSIITNVGNIDYAGKRMNYLIDINLRIITLNIISLEKDSTGYLPPNSNNQSLYLESRNNLTNSASMLQVVQTQLNHMIGRISDERKQIISPNSIILTFLSAASDVPNSYHYTIWQAMLEIVVSSYEISNMNIGKITQNNSVVHFVNHNSMNELLRALNDSSQAIIAETVDSTSHNLRIFLYLLIAISGCLVISIVFIIPVINQVNKNKEDVFLLFLFIKKKDIDEQLNRCKSFLSQFQTNSDERFINENETPIDYNEEDEFAKEMKNDAAFRRTLANKRLDQGHPAHGRKKYKNLHSNLGVTIIKFIIILTIIEAYFVMIYLLSLTFLNSVSSLTHEFSLLIQRQPTHSLLLLIFKYQVLTKGNSTIREIDSSVYMKNYLTTLYNSEELMLNAYSQNTNFHSESYNNLFQNVMFNNACNYLEEFSNENEQCINFNQGILTKGIYSSVIKFWDSISQMNQDYLNSDKNDDNIRKSFLNSPILETDETMLHHYFNSSLNELIINLHNDITGSFSSEMNKNRIYFIIYIIFIIVVFVLIWRLFMNDMEKEFWKTKSVLSILPPDLIMTIPEIKTFILANSSTVFFSKK